MPDHVDSKLDPIQEALVRPWQVLKFAPALEAQYRSERSGTHARQICHFLWIYLAVNVLCIWCDWHQREIVFRLGIFFRLGLFMPVTLMAILLLSRQSTVRIGFLASVVPLIVDTALTVTLSRCIPQPFSDRYMLAAVCGIFGQMLIASIPFGHAVRGITVTLAVFCTLCSISWPGHFYPPVSADHIFFTCVIGVASLYERYRREQSDRKDFLLSESNRLHVEDVLAINARLERMSRIDSLTGVFNRAYLDTALARLWLVAAEHHRWIGIIMVDVDHFKSVNDTDGHRHGDFCLHQVAQAMQANVRPGIDTIARYGGEEFVGILPDADEREAMAIGERVRSAIEALKLRGGPRYVTVSVGLAVVEGGSTEITLEQFIVAADEALYAAKNSGRNRLSVRNLVISSCSMLKVHQHPSESGHKVDGHAQCRATR